MSIRAPALLAALLVLYLLPSVLAPTTTDHAPTSETITRGTTNGIANLLSDDGLTNTITEGAVAATEDFFPGTQVIDKGTQTGGTFPGDVDDSNDIRVTYQEANQAPANVDTYIYPITGTSTYYNAWDNQNAGCTITTHFDCVEEVWPPDDATSYVIAETTTSDKESHLMQDLTITAGFTDIDITIEYRCAASGGAAGGDSKMLIVVGVEEYTGTLNNCNSVWATFTDFRELSPSGDEWTAADVNAAQCGYVSGPDLNPDAWVSACRLRIVVTYTADYEAQWKYDWTGVTTTGTSWTLFVEGLQTANAETLDVRIFAADEIALSAVVCSITSTTEAEYNCGTLTTDQLDAGSPNIQFRDNNQAAEGLQSSWGLDRVRIERAFNAYDATVQHDWTTVALADSYQFRVRASTTGEAFNPQLWDWQDSDWNAMAMSVTAGVETLYTESLVVTCGGGADDCERNTASGAIRLRWLTASATDETQDTLTIDQEIVQRTDLDPTITGVTVTPASGTSLTTFDFQATYTDVVTCPATYMRYAVDGEAAIAMIEVSPADTNCADGKAYESAPDRTGFCPGTRNVVITASDGVNTQVSSPSTPFTITNIAPIVTPDLGIEGVDEGTVYTASFAHNDNDITIACQTQAWTMPTGPPECTIVAGTGAFTCTAALAAGTYAITVRVSDGTTTADESFTLVVTALDGGGDEPTTIGIDPAYRWVMTKFVPGFSVFLIVLILIGVFLYLMIHHWNPS